MSRNRKKNIKKRKNNTIKYTNKPKTKKINYVKPLIEPIPVKEVINPEPQPEPIIKKEKTNNKTLISFIILTAILIINCTIIYYFYSKKTDVEINDIYLEGDNILIKLNKNAKCSFDEEINEKTTWINSNNFICTMDFIDTITHVYIKDTNDNISRFTISKDFSIVDDIKIEKEKMYIAIDGTEKINYQIISRGSVKEKVTFKSMDEKIATVDEEGTVKGLANGETKIQASLSDKVKEIEVIITDLIIPKTAEFNYKKNYLTCNQYSKEENNLLDEILKERVNSVGRKTKAALVEVARFITLEFPYRISYFSENGRINAYGKGIDGEGRYYHEGLYLHSSRFSNISSSLYGPGTWGCRFYSTPAQLIQNNGLDCSGFISWIFVNAGFEVGDLGAGISSGADFTDLGERVRLTSAFEEGIVKVGDLLSQEPGGEHIALIAGMNDEYIFVAESLWYGTGYLGAIMRKYDKQELINNFYWLVDMKDFYEEEGKFTDYWIN